MVSGNGVKFGTHSRAAQAERAVPVAAIRFFLYIRFFLNAPLDLLLDVLTFRGPSLFTLLWWVPLNHFCVSTGHPSL